jgi:hypothetical protein
VAASSISSEDEGPGPAILPTFFVVGAARSGTSAVFDLLRRRRDVFVPRIKEPNFFAVCNATETSPALLARSVLSLDRYSQLYRQASIAVPRGDISPEYLRSASAPIEIARLVPDARIVAILRNPVDRAWSDYQLHVRNGTEHHSFREALARQGSRVRLADDRTAHYLDTGLYAAQLERYFSHFGREQVLVLAYDDLVRDPESTLREVFVHIGVARPEEGGPLRLARWNASGTPNNSLASGALRVRRTVRPLLPDAAASRMRPVWERFMGIRVSVMPMQSDDRNYLTSYFRSEIARLSALLDRDFTELWCR